MEGVNKLTDGKKTLTEKETYGRKEAASRGSKTGSGWRLKNNNNKKTKTPINKKIKPNLTTESNRLAGRCGWAEEEEEEEEEDKEEGREEE